ncbi:hypothetical protein PV05_00230 [Exophiala xenobiotica]|uniref:Uncharacterized protein n=1 Tax=Exophiala xenobiotica TaxID=348802 RepID=A0A0D2EW37_9EURO|nr:uncharacterized protein PV05_00230 [Exophiala xenobiotica]KIW59973.1 hypothetical protein PV05_00230 [Exophiala xenobiotica]
MSSPRRQRIILITGASQGLGLALATKLASFEHTHVLLSALSLASGEEAARSIQPVETSAITPLGLDINNDNSIRAAVSDISNRFGRLDVLVYNAGIFLDRPSKPGENVFLNDSGEVNFRDILRQTFETNVISPLQLTESLLPVLLNSGDPRVFFITSGLGSLALTLDENDRYFGFYAPAYKCSKAALNMVMAIESVKLRSCGVKVNATCPGAISTAMNGFREGLGAVEEGIINTVR